MQAGLAQRVTALNRFIHDVYHDQEIIKAGIVPGDQIFKNAQFRPEMMGVEVPRNIYSHISGVDIVRAAEADAAVEDPPPHRRTVRQRVLRIARRPVHDKRARWAKAVAEAKSSRQVISPPG